MQKVESYLFNYRERAVTKFASEFFGIVPTMTDCVLDNEEKFVSGEYINTNHHHQHHHLF